MPTAGAIEAAVGIGMFAMAAATATAGTWRQQRSKTTLANLTAAADAAERLAKTQTDEIAGLNVKLQKKDTQIADLNARVEVLKDMVTGKSAIEAVAAQLSTFMQHYEIKSTEFMQRYDARSGEILAQIDSVRQEVRVIAEGVTK